MSAQRPPLPSWAKKTTPAPNRRAPNITKAELETISDCLKDLQSEDAKVRKSATLVLGKYENNFTEKILTRTLKDDAVSVRSTAAVSLLERKSLAPGAALALLFLLDDENVHIRRLISSSISKLAMRIPSLKNVEEAQKPFGKEQKTLSQMVQEHLMGAFSDSDTTVRKNMVSNYVYLTRYVQPKDLKPLLNDKNTQIQAMVIKEIGTMLARARNKEQMTSLAKSSDRRVRLQLVKVLARAPQNHLQKTLQALTKDKDPAIALYAHLGLLKLTQKIQDPEHLKQLIEKAPASIESSIYTIAQLCKFAGDNGIEVLQFLLSHPSRKVRETALRFFPQKRVSEISKKQFFELFNDVANTIRRNAFDLAAHHPDAGEWELKPLLRSEFKNTRIAAIQLAKTVKRSDTEELLTQLLFDPSVEIRSYAIHEAANLNLDNWEKIAKRSLRDKALLIRKAGARMLLRTEDPEMLETLVEIRDNEPDTLFGHWLNRQIARNPSLFREEPRKSQ